MSHQLNPSTPAFEPANLYGGSRVTEATIKNVWYYNFKEEILNISNLLESYSYVGMDTEFPGIIISVQANPRDKAYLDIKENVNMLKLIQVGITLSDEHGNRPAGVNAWQFNIKFDLAKDTFSDDSINLLKSSGIDFDLLSRDGIDPLEFAEYFQISGLVYNDEVTYVTFHSGYDFAYLLKAVTCQPLPDSQEEFFRLLAQYFPEFYDLKFMVTGTERFRGGLNRIAEVTKVSRVGKMHQAGSDSLVTIESFFKVRSELFPHQGLEEHKNQICGLSTPLDLAPIMLKASTDL